MKINVLLAAVCLTQGQGLQGFSAPCMDSNPSCSGWAARGECERNKAFMNNNCKRSCNKCPAGVLPCQFPFIYKNIFYSACTTVDDPDGKPWCSTKTDNANLHIPGKFKSCTEIKTSRGVLPCQFPFIYKNISYSACTTVDDPDGKPWCSTQTDNANLHIQGKWTSCTEIKTPGGCEDDPNCTGLTSDFCENQGVVSDCQTLCHLNTTCEAKGNFSGGPGDQAVASPPNIKMTRLPFGAGGHNYNPPGRTCGKPRTSWTLEHQQTLPCVFPFTYRGIEYTDTCAPTGPKTTCLCRSTSGITKWCYKCPGINEEVNVDSDCWGCPLRVKRIQEGTRYYCRK